MSDDETSAHRTDRGSPWRHRGAVVEAGDLFRTPIDVVEILRHRSTTFALRSCSERKRNLLLYYFFFRLVVIEMNLLEAKILMTLSLFSERE